MKLKTKFQDEDFELGEVVEVIIDANVDGTIELTAWPEKGGAVSIHHESLAELTKYWEDVPEEKPKGNWTIDPTNLDYIDDGEYSEPDELERYEELGLRFETREDTERAVEKLKALTRLINKGLKFEGWYDSVSDNNPNMIMFRLDKDAWGADTSKDLDLLFFGEDE